MSSFDPFLTTGILNAIGHGQALNVPATWVALFTRGGAEIQHNDYSRLLVDVGSGSSPKWSTVLVTAGRGRIENDAAIVWPAATSDWPEVGAVGIFHAQSGGNRMMLEPLPAPKTIVTGERFRIPPQALKIELVGRSV